MGVHTLSGRPLGVAGRGHVVLPAGIPKQTAAGLWSSYCWSTVKRKNQDPGVLRKAKCVFDCNSILFIFLMLK